MRGGTSLAPPVGNRERRGSIAARGGKQFFFVRASSVIIKRKAAIIICIELIIVGMKFEIALGPLASQVFAGANCYFV